MKKTAFFALCLLIWTASCKQKVAEYPNKPQIYYQSINTHQVRVSDPNTMVSIHFKFTDGNQNIANDPAEQDSTIFLLDSRDVSGNDYTYAYPMPYIPKDQRPDGGLEGTITLNLNNGYFSPKDSLHLALGKDTMFWMIYIKDNDGNKSNIIKTDTIYLNYR